MSKYYIFLDAMQIQGYVFATNTLKIIIGASLALSRWQEECKNLCVKQGGELIYSAGGNVLAVFPDAPKAHQFRQRALNEIAPPALEIAWAEAEEADSDPATWEILQMQIARYKAGDRAGDYPAHPAPGIPGCGHCGLREPKDGPPIDEKKICSICHTLYYEADLNKYPVGSTLMEFLYQQVDREKFPGIFPSDLELLVSRQDQSQANDSLAIVVIDLNDVGRGINAVIHKEGFPGLQRFSHDLEASLQAMLKRVLCYLEQRPDGCGMTGAGGYLRLRPLLVGGDDIVLALPAPLWPGLVVEALSELHIRGYPACAGVVAARHTFPINRLAGMAEELVANAKRLSRHRQSQDACFNDCVLDWHTHQETAFTSPLQVRRRNYVEKVGETHSEETYEVGACRPYTLTDFLRLLDQGAQMKDSNRKLYSLYKGLRSGVEATRETLKYTFLRNENANLDKYAYLWDLLGRFPGKNPLWSYRQVVGDRKKTIVYETDIADILELKFLLDTEDTEAENV